MRVAVAADHGGYPLNKRIIGVLERDQHQVIDLGTNDGSRSDDYPDYARALVSEIRAARAERGILICGSGVGAAIAANKFPHIRAGLCHDTYSARQGVEHDDMNVLCLGARVVGAELALELVRAFMGASFTGEERHARRVAKIADIEQERN
jgi:ribose 5-phosphate isomerase B